MGSFDPTRRFILTSLNAAIAAYTGRSRRNDRAAEVDRKISHWVQVGEANRFLIWVAVRKPRENRDIYFRGRGLADARIGRATMSEKLDRGCAVLS